MSTFEMFKFWLIKETMPLWITLAVIAGLIIGCVVWEFIKSICSAFRRKPDVRQSPEVTKGRQK